MKKILCLIIVAVFAVAVCGCENATGGGKPKKDSAGDDGKTSSSSVEDQSFEDLSSDTGDGFDDSSAEEGGDTSAETDDTVENTSDINTIPIKFVDRYACLTGFKSETSGQTVSNVFGLNVTQSIYSVVIKNGERAYLSNKSESSFVKTSITSYFYNGKVNYKYKNDDYKVTDLLTYLGKFGVDPVGRSIEGFKIDDKTVLSVESVAVDKDYRFKIVLDPETSADAVKIQAKEFGGLDAYPVFSSIVLIVTMNNCFDPISIELSTEYKAKLLVETNCKQHYVVTFSDVNGEIAIPDEDMFNVL